MAEQRVHSLLDALDGRTRSLLERLAREREARRHAENVQGELAQRLGELERRLAEAQAAHRELAEEHRGLEEARRRLEEESRELKEERRELDEQNGELEAHNRHLHERLASGEPSEAGFRLGRRSQGLSALIGHRPAPQAGDTAASAPEDSGYHSNDSGHHPRRSATHRAMEAPQLPICPTTEQSGSHSAAVSETPQSPICRTTDKPGSYQAEVPDATHPVGARFIGRDQEPPRSAEASSSPETGEPPSPQALLGQWYQRYPAAFFKGHTRPLMVGIHEVLASREPWPEKLVRRALACYVNLPRYLKAMREDAERIDLDGQPAGKVDAQAADYAHRKLDRLQGEKRAGKGRNSQSRSHQGRGKPAGVEGQGKGKPKPKKGQGGGASQAANRPGHERAEPAPASMEEKLSALMAKHNDR